jgi:hypothetical protein
MVLAEDLSHEEIGGLPLRIITKTPSHLKRIFHFDLERKRDLAIL